MSQEIVDFFKCPMNEIDYLILISVIYFGTKEWLRGISKMRNIPRWTEGVLPHRINFSGSERDRAERLIWIVENGVGNFRFDYFTVWFDDLEDAVTYVLKFC